MAIVKLYTCQYCLCQYVGGLHTSGTCSTCESAEAADERWNSIDELIAFHEGVEVLDLVVGIRRHKAEAAERMKKIVGELG